MLARKPSRQKIPIAIQKPSVTFPHRNTEDFAPGQSTPTRDLLRLGVRLCMHRRENYQFPSSAQTQYNPAEVKQQHKKKETTNYSVHKPTSTAPSRAASATAIPYLPYRTVLDFANFLQLGTRHLLFSFLNLSSLSSLQLAFPVFLSIPPIIDSSVSACPSISGFAVVSHESRTILQSALVKFTLFRLLSLCRLIGHTLNPSAAKPGPTVDLCLKFLHRAFSGPLTALARCASYFITTQRLEDRPAQHRTPVHNAGPALYILDPRRKRSGTEGYPGRPPLFSLNPVDF